MICSYIVESSSLICLFQSYLFLLSPSVLLCTWTTESKAQLAKDLQMKKVNTFKDNRTNSPFQNCYFSSSSHNREIPANIFNLLATLGATQPDYYPRSNIFHDAVCKSLKVCGYLLGQLEKKTLKIQADCQWGFNSLSSNLYL